MFRLPVLIDPDVQYGAALVDLKLSPPLVHMRYETVGAIMMGQMGHLRRAVLNVAHNCTDAKTVFLRASDSKVTLIVITR